MKNIYSNIDFQNIQNIHIPIKVLRPNVKKNYTNIVSVVNLENEKISLYLEVDKIVIPKLNRIYILNKENEKTNYCIVNKKGLLHKNTFLLKLIKYLGQINNIPRKVEDAIYKLNVSSVSKTEDFNFKHRRDSNLLKLVSILIWQLKFHGSVKSISVRGRKKVVFIKYKDSDGYKMAIRNFAKELSSSNIQLLHKSFKSLLIKLITREHPIYEEQLKIIKTSFKGK